MGKTKAVIRVVVTRIPVFLIAQFILLLGWEKLNGFAKFNTFPIGLGLTLLSTYLAVNFIGAPIVGILFDHKDDGS